MKNRDLYELDPSTRKLVNEGVANVNDERDARSLAVLRYELETFVCDGQYAKGLEQILETYLKNLAQAQQPAVWVSGFFGSGKSHMVKMLRALWEDTSFPDGATARSLARLPPGIQDLLRELSAEGKRHGGIHAAAGTLGASASGSVRLALLAVVFRSAGLPGAYPQARFLMWLRSEGILDEVRKVVEASGCDWEEEVDNFLVAESLHDALVQVKPKLFATPEACLTTLNNLYPYVSDVGNDDMVKAIRAAVTVEKKFPLTLVVLDEVMQFIGADAERSIEVQEVVEACCKNIGSKLLFLGTGQTAITGTANLKKLEGRFTVRIELSDADVDAVIRKVILQKKPSAIQPVEAAMQGSLGEISRHLASTSIGHRPEDAATFAQDYPILPVRRRFWEVALRVLDRTGTDSQLRNQLAMVHKAVQTNLDAPLGHVIPADYLYFDLADKLLQSRILPRKVYDQTIKWIRSDEEERLKARATGLVFLVNRLAAHNQEVGIRADADTIADLLVEDLDAGSSELRGRLPALLDACELLIRVGDEYRIQTEESAAWNDEFQSQRAQLASEAHRIEAERDDRIRGRLGELLKGVDLKQGSSKVSRSLSPVFDATLPRDAEERVCVWIRDEWSIDRNSVRAEALQAGNQSPTVFVFLPKRSADDLRHHLIESKAARATLDRRGVPTGPDGEEARSAIETIRQGAEARIRELIEDSILGARVFQGGGAEVTGKDLPSMLVEAAERALQRLYPQFATADDARWGKVYEKAKKGAPDALKALDFQGEPAQHPVCKAILVGIGAGRRGTELRSTFEGAPYGWSGDAVDGALQVLLVAGLLRAVDERGATQDPLKLDRRAIAKASFRIEAATVTTKHRVEVRKLMQRLGVKPESGNESAAVPNFVAAAERLARRAGGEPPRPEVPDLSALEEIRRAAGNEQLLGIYNRRDELKQAFEHWQQRAELLEARIPAWQTLEELLGEAGSLPEAEALRIQRDSLHEHRLLLAEPDPLAPMLQGLTQLHRGALNRLEEEHTRVLERGLAELEQDADWVALEPEQREELLGRFQLTEADRPACDTASTETILESLRACSLGQRRDRVLSLPTRFQELRREVARLRAPSVRFVTLPRRTLTSTEEIEEWVQEVQARLREALAEGPVGIQ